MTVATGSPFTAEELEPTLRPLLEASLLPQRAYVDEAVVDWEAQHRTGTCAVGYTPGRYTQVEGTVHAFDRMVAEAYLRR